MALLAFVLALSLFITWLINASAPVKVNAQGIIIASGGLNQIVANTQGRLKTLDVKVGDSIAVGDVIATFEQLELGRELKVAQADVEDSRLRFDQLKIFYRENNHRESSLEKERVATIKQIRKRLKERLALLRKKQKNVSQLFKKRIITEDVLIQVQLSLSDLRERLAELDDEEKTLSIRKQERVSKQKLALLDEQFKIKQHQRKSQRLKSQFGEQQNLTSTHQGRVIEVLLNAGDVVEPGKALLTISPEDNSDNQPDNQSITALLYVNPTEGKRIRVGMITEIIPSAFKPEEFGYMLGEVKRVSELPATLEGMRRVLKNEQLARDLIQSGAPFEVRVTLLNDSKTPSGYKWSSSRGPDTDINSGMLLNARVVVKRMRLINFVIPQFDRLVEDIKRWKISELLSF